MRRISTMFLIFVLSTIGLGQVNQIAEAETQGTQPSSIVKVTTGMRHTCALTSKGGVACWGDGPSGALGLSSLSKTASPVFLDSISDAVDVSAGTWHTCAVLKSGVVMCWGDNTSGQLGNGSTSNSWIPVAVQGLTNAVSVSAGTYHTCALTSLGKVFCWGSDTRGYGTSNTGQLGNGSPFQDSSYPSEVQGLAGPAIQISSGESHTCAVLESKKIQCWGKSRWGELGNGGLTNSPSPDFVSNFSSKEATQVSASFENTCSLLGGANAGDAYCWGFQTWGVLGEEAPAIGSYVGSAVPVKASISGVTYIDTGGATACAIKNREVWCWGSNQLGQIQSSSLATSGWFEAQTSTPTKVNLPGPVDKISISEGVEFESTSAGAVCAWSSTDVYCWGGSDATGQQGNGTFSQGSSNPQRVILPSEGPIQASGSTIASGQSHTCALEERGRVRCWGANFSGQTSVPSGLGRAKQLTAGVMHTCALEEHGEVVCWGLNHVGQTSVPFGLEKVTQIVGGSIFTCAVHSHGQITCWGDNGYGQTSSPSQATDVIQVAAGDAHVCALDNVGKISCWGRNDFGQANVPSGLGKIVQIATGSVHTCAVNDHGQVSCWGYATYGAIVPSGLEKIKQISAGYSHTCALDDQGMLMCWGHNPYGANNVPGDLGRSSQIVAAGYHTCAVNDHGAMSCWGWNQDGQTSVPADLGRILPPRSRELMTAKPNIEGLFILHTTVAAVPGDWESDVSFTYQWFRDGIAIESANSGLYVFQTADYLEKISVAVTGTKEGYISETKTSDPVIPVKPKEKIASLRFTGNTQVGSTVSVSPSPRNSKFDYSYQWFRNGSEILGANSKLQLLSALDVGASLSVKVCALYLKDVTNCLTQNLDSPVKLGLLKNIKASISGVAKVGRQFVASRVTSDSQTSVAYQWLRNETPIADATSNLYFVDSSDRGSSISLRVTVTKPGYETEVKTSSSKLIN